MSVLYAFALLLFFHEGAARNVPPPFPSSFNEASPIMEVGCRHIYAQSAWAPANTARGKQAH